MSSIEITPELLTELRKRAERASGPATASYMELTYIEIDFHECATPAVMLALVDEIERLKAELENRPIIWAVQNISTKKLSERGDSVELYKSHEDADRDIWSCFFEPSDWKAVIYTGEQQ